MSETTTDLRPEVAQFLARVEEHLLDLPATEREEVLGGLAADLDELVGERGSAALGDPETYAAELRAAAGLPAPTPTAAAVRPVSTGRGPAAVREAGRDLLDAVHGGWDRLLDAAPGDPRGFLAALQPVWWMLRGVVAWVLAQELRGPWLVVSGAWVTVLVVLVVGSVQLGRGAWRLGDLVRRSLLLRVAVVGLNLLAVALLPGAADRIAWQVAEQRAWQYGVATGDDGDPGTGTEVVTWRGRQACELEVLDARDRPVEGGYVLDLTNDRRLPLSSRRC